MKLASNREHEQTVNFSVSTSGENELQEYLHCTPFVKRPSSALPFKSISALGHHCFYSPLGTTHTLWAFEVQRELKEEHSLFIKKGGKVAG